LAGLARDLKKLVPMGIALIVGIFGAFAYFYYTKPTDDLLKNAVVFQSIVGYMAMAISFINISLIHGKNLQRRRKGWIFSILLIFMMFFSLVIGLGVKKGWPSVGLFDWGLDDFGTILIDAIQNPAGTAMFSLLAFYIASAAYRTFRIRGIDSAILLVSGALVLLGQAPIGSYIFGPQLLDLKTWILSVPNMAGSRGITLGIAVGSVAMGIRVLFGYERRPVLGGVE